MLQKGGALIFELETSTVSAIPDDYIASTDGVHVAKEFPYLAVSYSANLYARLVDEILKQLSSESNTTAESNTESTTTTESQAEAEESSQLQSKRLKKAQRMASAQITFMIDKARMAARPKIKSDLEALFERVDYIDGAYPILPEDEVIPYYRCIA